MRTSVWKVLAACVGVGLLGGGAWRARAAAECGPECRLRPQGSPPVACNLGVFTPEERRAHEREGTSLLAQVRSTRELDDGFELRLPASTAASVAHWVVDERRCCPFLSFEIRVAATEEELAFVLRGPVGAKEILRPLVAMRSPPVDLEPLPGR